MQDAPFLVFRLLLIFKYGVVSYSNTFYTCKNTLVYSLLLYRLVVVQVERLQRRKSLVTGTTSLGVGLQPGATVDVNGSSLYVRCQNVIDPSQPSAGNGVEEPGVDYGIRSRFSDVDHDDWKNGDARALQFVSAAVSKSSNLKVGYGTTVHFADGTVKGN